MQLDKGELGGSVDGDQKVELALRVVDRCVVDVDLAKGRRVELAFGWRRPPPGGQAEDIVPLEAAVQG